uniref:Uncharacterized protein n=1 Tax=Pseudomonas phage PMBT23 TaxID=3137284 RepID=A0AAU8BU99_9VIRU
MGETPLRYLKIYRHVLYTLGFHHCVICLMPQAKDQRSRMIIIKGE